MFIANYGSFGRRICLCVRLYGYFLARQPFHGLVYFGREVLFYLFCRGFLLGVKFLDFCRHLFVVVVVRLGAHGIAFEFVTYRREGTAAPEAAPAPDAASDAADERDVHVKTMILYRSKHHGNTKKIVDAIAAAYPDDVDTVDVATLDKGQTVDLSEYPLVGVASGIYYGEIDRDLARVLQNSLIEGTFVFSLLTYGGESKWYGKDIDGICRAQRANYLAGHGCAGFDTWGPFKLTGGMNKGRPNEDDLADMVSWYRNLVQGYGEPLNAELEKRRRREAWNAAHPDPTMLDKLKNTGRKLFRRGGK